MRRALLPLAAALALGGAAVADDAVAATWRPEQPAGPAGVPVGIGPIGDVAFWAPNRGLAITAGNDAYPAGVWAYDGTGWRQLSTVCGGHDGRIAWAGPNDFWTVSDTQPGQELLDERLGHGRSLCHFRDGEIVASYAEPVLSPAAYLPMRAAACLAPNDCWFAGESLPGTVNVGAFHLRWDGSALTAIPSLETPQPETVAPPYPVADLAAHQGQMYESIEVREDAEPPSRVHVLQPESSSPFVDRLIDPPLDLGEALPSEVRAFRLASDGATLWGAAGGRGSRAGLKVVRLDAGAFALRPVDVADPEGAIEPGSDVRDAAAEPGTGAVWIAWARRPEAGGDPSHPARVARIVPTSPTEARLEDVAALPGPADGLNRKGGATALACPASGQCWVATDGGWLFHLGDALPRDEGFAFDHLLTLRPRDRSLPTLPPDELPIDDSGANLPPDVEIPREEPVESSRRPRRIRPLVANVKPRLLRGTTTMRVAFTLRARARVQAVARRRGRVVARSKRRVMAPGRRAIDLRLDPRRWPTRLAVRATRVSGAGRSGRGRRAAAAAATSRVPRA